MMELKNDFSLIIANAYTLLATRIPEATDYVIWLEQNNKTSLLSINTHDYFEESRKEIKDNLLIS